MFDFPLTLVPAAELAAQALAELLNAAYSDYFVPVWLDAEHVARMCRDEDVDLENSVVALVDEVPAGIALLSVRERRGWVSGVGVVPGWRRKGIGRQVLRRIQAIARAANLETLRLEVLAQNEGGLALYQELGFTWERDLLVLTLEPGLFDLAPYPPPVRATEPEALLVHYDAFHDVPASWQRQRASLAHRLPLLRGLGFWEDDRLCGYVLYRLQRHTYAVQDLAVAPEHPQRLDIARTLLRSLHTARTDLGGHVINVPAEDPLLPAFTGLRYRIWQRQHALVWPVGPGQAV